MSQKNSEANIGTALALMFVMLCVMGLLALGAMAELPVMGLLLVLAGFIFLGLFHYVVWGYWLGRLLPPLPPEELPQPPAERHTELDDDRESIMRRLAESQRRYRDE